MSLSLFVAHQVFLKGNNSALGGHRALPKVVNERYCNMVLIFCENAHMRAVSVLKVPTKKMLFRGWNFFWGGAHLHVCMHVQCASPLQGLEARGP